MVKHYMRHPDDILSATRSLTLEQRGIYNDLIDLFIARDGDLPDDDQKRARDIAIDPRLYRRLKRELLDAGKIEIRDGVITPTGALKTLRVCLSKSEMARKAAYARWEKRGIAPLDKTDLDDSYGLATLQLSSSDSLASDLTHGKITKPAMRTHEKRICQPEPEKKERKKEEEGADAPVHQYVFEGKVIRLSEDHFNDWKKAYPHIPDLRSELYTRDMWLAEQPEERHKNWFISTSTVLNKKNQEYAAAETLDKKLNPSKYLPRGVGL